MTKAHIQWLDLAALLGSVGGHLNKLGLSLVFSYMPPQRVLYVQACQPKFEGFPEGLGSPRVGGG